MARLLFFAERFPPDIGGVSRSALRTVRALADLGHDVHVLAWTRQLDAGRLTTWTSAGAGEPEQGLGHNAHVVADEQPKFAAPLPSDAPVPNRHTQSGEAPHWTVHRLGMYGSLDLSLQHTLNVLEWLHDRHHFAGVWGHYLYPAGFAAVTFAQWLGLPCTVSARGNDVDRLMFPPGDFARLLWTLDRADVVSSVSRELADKINMLAGRRREVEVIGNAVDAETFRGGPPDLSLRREIGIAPPELVLGFCGELRHKKGLPFLLSALACVRQARPACLLVIGSVRAREQAALASFGAEHPEAAARIFVTGPLDSQAAVADHLRLCDVFLQPSLWDGLPNAVLEAMACERLVVASDAGGIPEVIKHREHGLLIPRAHLHRLGEVILELFDQPEPQRQQLASAARRRVLDRFGYEHERAALQRVMERLFA
ncbi:MAG: glycosyltransferase [Planctomycetales bacterium]|nr:glycosyltransferase [Planctomycetales bacterium]